MPEDFITRSHHVSDLDPGSCKHCLTSRTKLLFPPFRCTGQKLRAQLWRLPAESVSGSLLLCGRHQRGQLPASRHRCRSPGNRREEHHSRLRKQSSCALTQYDIHSRKVHRCVFRRAKQVAGLISWLLLACSRSRVCLVFPLWSKTELHVDSQLPVGVNVSMCLSGGVRPALSSDRCREKLQLVREPPPDRRW